MLYYLMKIMNIFFKYLNYVDNAIVFEIILTGGYRANIVQIFTTPKLHAK